MTAGRTPSAVPPTLAIAQLRMHWSIEANMAIANLLLDASGQRLPATSMNRLTPAEAAFFRADVGRPVPVLSLLLRLGSPSCCAAVRRRTSPTWSRWG